MTTPDHQDYNPLRTRLLAEADQIQIPPLPARAIRQRGAAHRARRRSLQTVAGSMAVLVVATVAITVGPGWPGGAVGNQADPGDTSVSASCRQSPSPGIQKGIFVVIPNPSRRKESVKKLARRSL